MSGPMPPNYDYEVTYYAGHAVLCITDLFDADNPSITVTNAAEHVLKKIQRDTPLPKMIIYRDTDGVWDRLVINERGVFAGFSPISPGHNAKPTELDTALQLLVTSQADRKRGVM
jgi:Ni,Fe-hydrogenase III small subunit